MKGSDWVLPIALGGGALLIGYGIYSKLSSDNPNTTVGNEIIEGAIKTGQTTGEAIGGAVGGAVVGTGAGIVKGSIREVQDVYQWSKKQDYIPIIDDIAKPLGQAIGAQQVYDNAIAGGASKDEALYYSKMSVGQVPKGVAWDFYSGNPNKINPSVRNNAQDAFVKDIYSGKNAIEATREYFSGTKTTSSSVRTETKKADANVSYLSDAPKKADSSVRTSKSVTATASNNPILSKSLTPEAKKLYGIK